MINDEKFNQSLLTEIKDKKILPLPKWRFSVHNILLWALGVLSLLLGALSVSLVIYMQNFKDLPMYRGMETSGLDLILLMVPLFWLLSLAVFVILIYFNFKKTDKGYRYRPIYILATSLCLSLVLGFLFHLAGTGILIDDWLSERAPYYDKLVNPHMTFWSDPEHGRLIGMVTSEMFDNNFSLQTPNQDEWQVFYESNQAMPIMFIEPGLPVRCLGHKIEEGKFAAEQVMPVMPGRKFLDRPMVGCPHVKPGGSCGQKINKRMVLPNQDFKNLIGQSLIQNKDKVKELIKQDPHVLMELEMLKLRPEVVRSILE